MGSNKHSNHLAMGNKFTYKLFCAGSDFQVPPIRSQNAQNLCVTHMLKRNSTYECNYTNIILDGSLMQRQSGIGLLASFAFELSWYRRCC